MSQDQVELGIWVNSMKTPKSMIYNTGEEQPAREKIMEFFLGIADEIEPKKDVQKHHFNIKRSLIYGSKTQVPVEGVHMLFYEQKFEQKVVAVVTETRTPFNYVRFDFFQNLENVIENP